MIRGKSTDFYQVTVGTNELVEIRQILNKLIGPSDEYLALNYEDYTTVRALIALEMFLKKRQIQPSFRVNIAGERD